MNMKKIIIIAILSAAVIFPASDSRGEISKQKRQEIADKLYDIELSGGDSLGYCSEILQHLEKSSHIRPAKYNSDSFDDVDRLNQRGSNIDLYSLLSGGLAIKEALQLESIRPSDEWMREIDPAALNLVNIESHPYEKMLKNRNYTIYPMDKKMPEDFYYIHFNNALKALNFLNFIYETGGALHSRFSASSVDFMVKEKLLTQLALRDSSEFQAFYSGAVSELAIAGSDPFIIEGSDVTLIIRPVQGPVFNSGLTSMRRAVRDKYSAKEKEILISGIKGSHLYTDNRQVWSVMLTLTDGTVVISNSVKAAERVADTFSGKIPALSEAQDYRYMRSIYPAGRENEDGFIYLSEKFIRHMVSPQLRIKEARRMYEEMKISVLEKYMIFHYQLTGKFPVSIEEVMESAGGPSLTDPRKKELDSIKNSSYYARAVKLEQGSLADWDSFRSAIEISAPKKTKSRKKSKQKLSSENFIYDLKLFYRKITGDQAFTPADVLGIIEAVSKPGGLDSKRFSGLTIRPGSFSAGSETYGRVNFMTPLIEIETGKISKREAEEYRRFASSYNSFWKDYLDPAGIRIKNDPGLTIETCILPLINNFVYNFISGMAGGAPVELHPDSKINGDTMSIAFKVNPLMLSTYLTLSGLGVSKSISDSWDVFTGEVQFHMSDALPLADFDTPVLAEFFSGSIIRSSEVLTGFLAWSLFHPMRIALPVKKPKEGFILVNNILDRIIEKNNSNNFIQSESYLTSYHQTELRVVKLVFFSSLITRLYIAEKDSVVHIASTEKYMKQILDSKPVIKPSALKSNAALVFRPSEMIQERDMYRAGMIENGLLKSRRNIGTIKLMGMIFPEADNRELPDLAYRNFGFKPVCPLGGEYFYDKKTGNVRNSVYGGGNYPVIRIDENSNGIIPVYLKNFFRTSELRIELEFIPEGIKTKLVNR